jgi:hypothetical protein
VYHFFKVSNIVKIVFLYGLGNVLSNEMGVDRSEFKFVSMDLTAPKTWTVEQLKDWLTECFRLNSEVCTVGVHVLWTKSTSIICWYLRLIDNTSKWVN